MRTWAPIALLALTACTRTEPTPAPKVAPASSAASAPEHQPASAPASAAELGLESPGTPEQLSRLDAGNVALTQGNRAEARAHFRAAMAGPATGAWVSAGLALASLLEVDAPAEAAPVYAQLEAAAPIAEVHFAAGRYHGSQGDSAKARAALERAVAANPDFLPAYPLLGGLLVKTGAAAEAGPVMIRYEERIQGAARRLADPAQPLGTRLGLVELFAVVDDERSVQALVDRLGDPLPELRAAAAAALSDLPEPAGVEALARAALAERDPVVRQLMASALRRARDVLRNTH